MTHIRTDRPVITLAAEYVDSRWTGTTTVSLPKREGVALDDVAVTLIAAGCMVLGSAEYRGGYHLRVSPSPLVHETLAGTCYVDGAGVHVRGGHAGEIVPWADPATVRHEDRLLGRSATGWDRHAEERAYLAWFGGDGPMPERAHELLELAAMYELPDARPGDYLGTGEGVA